MMRIAVTGHRGLPAQTSRLVDEAIRGHLAPLVPDVVGVSCLADGADTLFARAVLDMGGTLDAVVPARTYRAGLPAEHRVHYDDLLSRAAHVRELDCHDSTPHAHMEASEVMLADADQVLAVWDGQPARGYGGTADVVGHARALGIDVVVVWPSGASRG